MNYSPQNEQGLAGLIAGLQHNMDPSTALSMYQMIQQDQAAKVQQRQARLQGLSQLLMGAAQQGMPYAGAEALAQAAPGPMGPAVEQMMQALYPSGAPTPPATNANGAVMDSPSSGTAPYAPGVPVTNAPQNLYGQGAAAVSPAFQPPQPSVSDQLALQQAQAQADADLGWSTFMQDMTVAKGKGMDPVAAVQMFVNKGPENAQLLASDQSRAQGILEMAFGQMGVKTAGLQQP